MNPQRIQRQRTKGWKLPPNHDPEAEGDPLAIPTVPLSATAQVRMCGNSVCPPLAEALVRANFGHESLIYWRAVA